MSEAPDQVSIGLTQILHGSIAFLSDLRHLGELRMTIKFFSQPKSGSDTLTKANKISKKSGCGKQRVSYLDRN